MQAPLREPAWRATRLIRLSMLLHVAALAVAVLKPELWRWALGAVAVNHLLLTAVGLWPRSHWLGPNWTQLPRAAAARGEFALTIDDGPDPVVTPRVLDLLDRYATRATFFCVGATALRYPDLCREIVRRGHAIENHSQNHRHCFSLMGPWSIRREIQAGQESLSTLCGERPQFFRAPAGLRNPFLDPVLGRLDLKLASWSVRGFDTRTGDAGRVTRALLHGLKAGAILLLHDGNAARTAQGIPVIVEVLPALLEAAALRQLRAVTLRSALS